LLPDVDEESAARGAKSYPETSAQHHALWAAIMASMIGKKPTEAQRYINAAEATAALALAAPLAMPTETGIKALRETTTDDGRIGLLLCGYASRFGEVDLEGDMMMLVLLGFAWYIGSGRPWAYVGNEEIKTR
jgi:hypothetical protein